MHRLWSGVRPLEADRLAVRFKNHIDAAAVQAVAQHDRRGWPGLEPASVTHQPLEGLDRLELSVRVMQVAQALVAHLPADADRACGMLEASLGARAGWSTWHPASSGNRSDATPCDW
jgi:hypothetical protein